jgi:hypothetical protein
MGRAPSVVVFGTLHELQGPGFVNAVDDASYRLRIKQLVNASDFVFEESNGKGPSYAELAAKSFARGSKIGYLDIDAPTQRKKDGTEETAILNDPVDPQPNYISGEEKIVLHLKREMGWLVQIWEKQFKNALLICGAAHSFSMAFRLQAAGFQVRVFLYLPYELLCKRPHSANP